MSEPRRALITGITGQDGSYLAEFLLSQRYEVYGLVRRVSTPNDERIAHLRERVTLLPADLLDEASLIRALQAVRPHELYNLAAQSFVQTSFIEPTLTGEVTALGVTRLLEAVRHVDPGIRFYQASSSEMFGKAREVPQRESTPFHPRSPYGVAKLYGHWITRNYREAYRLFAVSGILFNHECVSITTPLIVRQNGSVNVVTPNELVAFRNRGWSQQSFDTRGLEIWDGTDWTPVRTITVTRRRASDPDHRMLSVQARGGAVEVTSHHRMLGESGTVLAAEAVQPGQRLACVGSFPQPPGWTVLTPELAEFLGLLAAEGYVAPTGQIQFTNNDVVLRQHVAELWSKLFLGTAVTRYVPSGWDSAQDVGQLYLNGGRTVGRWLRGQLYSRDGLKRVPALVLNSTTELQRSFLCGYYAGDGLKAGRGDSIRSSSALLAQGVCWLYANLGRWCSVYVEHRNERVYYQLNIGSDHVPGSKGQHLRKSASEVRRVQESPTAEEWVFDLETESGLFSAGIGRLLVHNSPRRGLEFVTRKITDGAARIKLGLARELRLGNLEAKRDWGFAGDYVRAMWLMLQQDEPDDYVVATGETHSVREFCELAFGALGLDWQEHVVSDPAYTRPAEVEQLIGDAARAREKLGWEPTVAFAHLVRMMVDADLARLAARAGRPVDGGSEESLPP